LSAPELAIGHIVDGKYAIQGVLNHAGVIATYRAATDSNQQVAIKFYDPRLTAFPDVVDALTRCETLIAELPGNLVVRIVDGGKDPGTGALYTVTPFDADPSLGELLEWSPLSPSEMVAFVQSLARVLDAVHAHGIAHLSLKPTNLFVGPGPAYHVRVVDFATSLVRSALASREEREASVEWLAPEQHGHAAGPAADVFASALIAFYALTGKSYWRSAESSALDDSAWQQEIAGSPLSVSQRARELLVSLDSAFDPVFARALAIAPEDRFPSVGQFAEALAAAIQPGASTTSNAATGSATSTPIAEALIVDDLDERAPTSTSAVVLAPSVPPEGARPSMASMPAVDVPPPPPQMDAVLASFETAAPERFRIGSDRTPSSGSEPLGKQVSTRPATSAPRKRSPLLWIAGVAAGTLVAVGIVWQISVGKNATAGGVARAASAPAPSATANSELPAAPVTAIAPSNDPTLSPNASAVVEPRTRAPAAKPAAKTVRSPPPAQPRAAPSSAPRRSCGKSPLKPCK